MRRNVFARRIVDNRSPVAIALARQMMYRNAAQPHPLEAHRIDSLAMFYTSLGDGKEGVRSFLEKRAPQFSSRASAGLPAFCRQWMQESKDGDFQIKTGRPILRWAGLDVATKTAVVATSVCTDADLGD